MRKYLFAVLAVLLTTVTAFGQQIKIDSKHHIANVGTNGFCAHCCIETIGRYHGFTATHGRVSRMLEQRGDEGGSLTFTEIGLALQNYDIAYYYVPREQYMHEWLQLACRNEWPCIIGMWDRVDNVGHAVVLVHYVPGEDVGIIDSNDIGHVTWLPYDTFQYYCYEAIIVYSWHASWNTRSPCQ